MVLLLKATVLFVLTLAVVGLLRRASAATRHGLLTLAFGALLLLPALTVILPDLPVPLPASWSVSTSSLTAQPDVVPASPAPLPPQRFDAAALLLGIWLMGSAASVAMVIVSLWNVRRLAGGAGEITDPVWLSAADRLTARLGLGHTPRLLVSQLVDTPMAGGLWRRVIFLPQTATTWSDEYRDVVLSHEMAHAARRDPLWHVLVRLSIALYWFHPLAWIAARQARAAQEQACDAAVLALGTKPSVYARVLMHLAEPAASTRPLAAVPMAGGCFLETRIMAILESGTNSHRTSRLLLPVAAVVLSTLAVAAATPDPQASRPAARRQALRETAPRQAAPPVPATEHALRVEVAALLEQLTALRIDLEHSRQSLQAKGGEIAALQDALDALRRSNLAKTEREIQVLAEEMQRLVKSQRAINVR